MHLPFHIVFFRIMCALVCGAVLGLERERLEHSAGLRTHTLVSISSCLLMIVSAFGFADVLTPGLIVLDPSRMAAQVVSGIGFLGAGVIMFRQSHNTISGLNTAASIWSAAAIGLCCGGGLIFPALLSTVLILMVQTIWRTFEHRFFVHGSRLTLHLNHNEQNIIEVERVVQQANVRLRSLTIMPAAEQHDTRIVKLVLENATRKDAIALLQELQAMKGMLQVEYEGLRKETLEEQRNSARLSERK